MALPLPGVVGDLIARMSFDALAAAIMPVAVTKLPTTPFDGQEVLYLADSTNGVVWHLKYRAASASAFKWEYVGGAPLYKSIATDEALAAGTSVYLDLTTVGPSITVPLKGDYEYAMSVNCYPVTAAAVVQCGLSVNGGAVATPHFLQARLDAAGQTENVGRADVLTGLAASDVVKMVYLRSTTQTQDWRCRSLLLRPIRVG